MTMNKKMLREITVMQLFKQHYYWLDKDKRVCVCVSVSV